MIRTPRYQEGDTVNISTGSGIESVKVLATTISVESQEIYYKVCLYNKTDKEFIVSEDEVITGYYSVPIPAFAVGDVISYVHTLENTSEIRSGVIETVNITWSEEGWTIYYKTDEHPEGEYVFQDDVVDSDMIDDSLEEEKQYGVV